MAKSTPPPETMSLKSLFVERERLASDCRSFTDLFDQADRLRRLESINQEIGRRASLAMLAGRRKPRRK